MRLRFDRFRNACLAAWSGRHRARDAGAVRERLRQQEAVAGVGLCALREGDPAALMSDAAVAVARALLVPTVEILELLPGEEALLLRAGVGWKIGRVGQARVTAGAGSQGSYTLLAAEPVIVEDLATDGRFAAPDLLREHGIASGVSVVIPGHARPYGVLGAHSTRPRRFTRDDAHFLQAVASVLGLAVERDRARRGQAALLERERVARAQSGRLAAIGRLIGETLDLPEVAQRIAHSVLDLLAAEGATVLSLDAASGDLRVLAVAGAGLSGRPGDLAFRRGTGLSGLAVATRQPQVSADLLADPRLDYHPAMRERLSRSPIRNGLAVPLIARGRVIGVLALGSRQRQFRDDDVRLASAFGDEAAGAIWNAQLHEELRARLTASETLLAVNEQIAVVVDLTETLRRVARQVGLALGADMVGAFLADPDERHLRPIAGWHVPPHLRPEFLTHAIPLKGHPILEEAWQRRAPVWLKNVGADPRVDRAALERFPHRSSLFCPIIAQGRPVGGLFLAWWEVEREFTAEELKLVEGIGLQAGIALANARLVEELRAHQARLEALLEVTRGLSRIPPPPALLGDIARACGTLLGSDSVRLRLIEGDQLVLAATWGNTAQISRPRLAVGESLTGRVAATGEPLVVTDPESDPRLIGEHRERIAGCGYRAWLGVPVRIGDRTAGVLSMHTRRAEGFSAADVAIAGTLASQAAVALENARLYEEVDEARQRLSALSRRLVDSQEAERRHLARELHDEVGQLLTSLKLALEAEVAAAAPAGERPGAERAQALVHELIARVRSLSLDLRPAMLDDLGLVPALVWHFDRYTAQTRVEVRLELHVAAERFPPAIETAAYRIVQEALTNVARHARVADATVRLWTADGRLYVQVEDAGAGFDPDADGASRASSGLAGMRERAALLGGELTVDAAPRAGVRMTAELPLDAGAELER